MREGFVRIPLFWLFLADAHTEKQASVITNHLTTICTACFVTVACKEYTLSVMLQLSGWKEC